MKKKQKRKGTIKQSFATAAYKRGMDLYLQNNNPTSALKYLLKAARAGYRKAYGEIGIILNREKNEPDKAEEWLIKAEASDCLLAPAAYYYGLLLFIDKENWADSLKYFQKSAEEGFELAYGQFGTILYLEKLDFDEAERWFEKAEKAGCLDAPQAHDYGMLLIEERGDTERGKRYLKMAEEDGYY